MKINRLRKFQSAKVGKILLLWFLGVPLGAAVLFVYLAGCK